MLPESLAGLKFVAASKRAPTKVQFLAHFAPYGQAVLDSIYGSHVEEVKGKLALNEAGKAVLAHFTESK